MMSTTSTFFYAAFFVWIISNVQMCPNVSKLKIVPGSGWDALTNKDTKQIMQLTYDQCKLTPDGKHLLPDNTFAVPLDNQEKQIEAEIFEHWSNYTTLSSAGFEVATDVWPQQFLPLYYTFSDDYQQMKSIQVKNETFTCRSQIRRVIYRINATSNAIMREDVKERFQQVITALTRNNTEEARNLAEIIVMDFGTHYTKNIDVGTVIAMEDYLKNCFLTKHANDKNKILSASKLSLLEYDTGFALDDQQRRLDSSLLSEYKEATLKKKIRFSSGLNWEENTECLVAIDRSGDVLTGLVTSSNFPKASPAILITVRQLFSDVIRDYYTRNILRGCTRPKSSNFDFAANLDDDSCKSPVSDYILGGFHSLVKSNPYSANDEHKEAKNPLTGSLSCPTNFQSQVFSSLHYYYGSAYQVWNFVSCLALANDSAGPSYLFGGLSNSYVDNIHTKNKSCPQFYTAVTLPKYGWILCYSSTDNDLAKQYALPFGGFATVDTDYQCPSGYKRHFAAPVGVTVYAVGFNEVEYGKLYYCLQEQNVKNLGVVPPLIGFP